MQEMYIISLYSALQVEIYLINFCSGFEQDINEKL